MGVCGVFHHQTQLNDALIAYHAEAIPQIINDPP